MLELDFRLGDVSSVLVDWRQPPAGSPVPSLVTWTQQPTGLLYWRRRSSRPPRLQRVVTTNSTRCWRSTLQSERPILTASYLSQGTSFRVPDKRRSAPTAPA